jgi:O-antigen/teichoic acid export membrane protein
MFSQLRQLGKESLVYGLAGVVSKFIGFFLLPIYTRIFSPEDYGVIGIITTTMAAISIFVVLGLDAAAGRWYYDTEDIHDRKRSIATWASTQVIVASFFGLLIFINAKNLGVLLLNQEKTGIYFQYTGIWLPTTALGMVATNWLRFQRRPWATAIFALATSLSNILLAIYFVVVLRWGLRGVYQAQLLAGVISTVLAVFILRDWINPRYFSWPRLKVMLRFALPLIPGSMAYWIVNFSDRYFVQYYTNTSEVGLYQVGANLASAVAILTTAFQQAWGPFALSIHTQKDARKVYAATLSAYLVITCLATVGLTLLAPEIINLVATKQYSGASTVIGFLSMSYVLIGLTYIAATGPTIVKRSGPTGIAMTMAAVFNVILNILLVPRLGRTGSALATMLAQAVIPIYLFYRAQSMYPIPYRFRDALGILAVTVSLIVFGVIWQPANPWMGLIVRLALTLMYIPALFLLRIVTVEQFRGLFGSLIIRRNPS